MGSGVRYSNLEAFEVKFGEKIRNFFAPTIGLTIDSISDVGVDYHVFADVSLSDGTVLNTHYRWSTEEEDDLGKEIKENPDNLTYLEYFNEYVKGKVIEKIETGYDRDDDLYAYLVVDGGNIEVPMYFDPEGLELGDSEIISREEFEAFVEERINR